MPAAVLVVLAAVLWGTTGSAQELGPDGIDPLVVGAVRLLIGAAGLWVVALLRGATRSPLDRTWLAVAVVSVALYQLTFFGGVRLAGVALGTAVGIGSAPLWGGAVDAVFVGWRPSRRWIVSAVLAIAGVALVAGDPGDADRPALGLSLAVGAGASYALYSFALQRLARSADADHVAAVVFTGAALVLAPALVLGDATGLGSGRGVVMALHLGLVATTLSYALFTRGVRDTPVSTALLLTLAEPITAVLLGVLVVGEVLEPIAAAGIGLILVGVGVATRARPVVRRSRLRA